VAEVVSVRSPWALLEPSAVDGSRHVPELKGTGPVTTTFFSDRVHIAAAPGVYAPQHDSHLLIDVLEQMGRIQGRTAVDLCTGSGVVAIAAARLGAAGPLRYRRADRSVAKPHSIARASLRSYCSRRGAGRVMIQ
jgi:Ribosomal protein L11 methyltransferase (PrmA)